MALRLIETVAEQGTLTAKVYYDSDWQEYQAKVRDGKNVLGTYHTDDKQDALDSGVEMFKEAIKNLAPRAQG